MSDVSRKQASGFQKRKAKRLAQEADAERERERGGLNEAWRQSLKKIGEPPFDPLLNSEWANQMLTAMAAIASKDETIPLEGRFKLVADLLDRVASSQSKASLSKRVRQLQADAGVADKKGRGADADGMVAVGAGTKPLRATRATVRGGGAA